MWCPGFLTASVGEMARQPSLMGSDESCPRRGRPITHPLPPGDERGRLRGVSRKPVPAAGASA